LFLPKNRKAFVLQLFLKEVHKFVVLYITVELKTTALVVFH